MCSGSGEGTSKVYSYIMKCFCCAPSIRNFENVRQKGHDGFCCKPTTLHTTENKRSDFTTTCWDPKVCLNCASWCPHAGCFKIHWRVSKLILRRSAFSVLCLVEQVRMHNNPSTHTQNIIVKKWVELQNLTDFVHLASKWLAHPFTTSLDPVVVECTELHSFHQMLHILEGFHPLP